MGAGRRDVFSQRASVAPRASASMGNSGSCGGGVAGQRLLGGPVAASSPVTMVFSLFLWKIFL